MTLDPNTATPTRARRHAAGCPTPSELGARVRAAREAVGLSQTEAGRRLKISQQTYAARETTTSLTYPTLLEMVRVLGYDPRILCPELFERQARHRVASRGVRK